jgi:hypothetical protein
MAINMTSLLTSYGISALTSSMTTAGVGVASWKMLHLTDALREFSLEPLQPPVVHHMSASSVMIDWRQTSRPETLPLPLPPPSTSLQGAPAAAVETAQKKAGVGVYVLVAGHHSETVDLRDLWGCDKYSEREREDMDTLILSETAQAEEGAAGACENVDSTETDSSSSLNKSHYSYGSEADGASWESLSTEPGVFLPRGARSVVSGADEPRQEDREDGGWWRTCVPTGPGAGEPFVLFWDRAELHRLYHAQRSFLLDKSVLMAAEELLKMASPVIGAAALPIAVLERAAELDCPWLVAMDRAEQAGKLLAAVLLKNRHASEESCGGKL